MSAVCFDELSTDLMLPVSTMYDQTLSNQETDAAGLCEESEFDCIDPEDDAVTLTGEAADAAVLRLLEVAQGSVEQQRRLSASNFELAVRFLGTLGDYAASADILLEEDGEIAFEWERGPRQSLTISVSDGTIGYSGLFGYDSAYGRLAFTGVLPPQLAILLALAANGQTERPQP